MSVLLVLALLAAGDVRPLTLAQVCATKWSVDTRHVSLAMRKAVFKRDGICWCDHPEYVVDHRVPRELGGADTLVNLWVQPLADAHRKDQEENRLKRAVCAGQVLLVEAQAQMRAWR